MMKHSQEFYYEHKSGDAIPARWFSPESFDGKFTTKSDVFSFSVVLFEILKFGETPYSEYKDQSIVPLIKSGTTLLDIEPNISNYPRKIIDLMALCFKYQPRQRISFVQIVEYLLSSITDRNNFKNVSFYYNHIYQPREVFDSSDARWKIRCSWQFIINFANCPSCVFFSSFLSLFILIFFFFEIKLILLYGKKNFIVHPLCLI